MLKQTIYEYQQSDKYFEFMHTNAFSLCKEITCSYAYKYFAAMHANILHFLLTDT